MSDLLTEQIERLCGSPVPIPPLDVVRRRRDARVRHRRIAASALTATLMVGAVAGYLTAAGPDHGPVATPPVGHHPPAAHRSPVPPIPRLVPDSALLRLRDLPAAGFHVGGTAILPGRVDTLRSDCGGMAAFHSANPPRDPAVMAEAEKTFWGRSGTGVVEVVRVFRPGAAAGTFERIRRAVRTCATDDWAPVPTRPFAGERDLLARGYGGAYTAVFLSRDVLTSVTVNGETPSEERRMARRLASLAASEVCAIGGGSCD